jgi:hypothetical protein
MILAMKKVGIMITIVLMLIFAGITCCGAYLVYQETQVSASVSDKADVKVNIKKDSLSFEIKHAIPGLIIFSFGAVGLIIMLIKVPVREILGYRTRGGGGRGMMGYMTQEPVFSEPMSIPLPVWWILKSTRRLEKMTPNA